MKHIYQGGAEYLPQIRGRITVLKIDVLGVQVDNVTLEEAVAAGSALAAGPGCAYVVTPNSEILYECRKTEGLTDILNGAGLVLPDGIGVVYASRILKRPLKEKVAGVDFAEALVKELSHTGKSLFLLGAKPGIAELAAEKLRERNPGLLIAGTHDGYFQEDGPVIEEIRASGADVVFVGLGAPKQELWMAKNGPATGAKLLAGLGGSLNVFAGVTQRAPDIWVRLGLEWLYRLIKEPWRFKRMCRLPLFLFSAMGARLRGE
jgi:N-acetylglucosaminyldiphosphoundecaprenol N-acetyl-beta-D-mannosaminyltransferase